MTNDHMVIYAETIYKVYKVEIIEYNSHIYSVI